MVIFEGPTEGDSIGLWPGHMTAMPSAADLRAAKAAWQNLVRTRGYILQ